jgi:hypothetical protein
LWEAHFLCFCYQLVDSLLAFLLLREGCECITILPLWSELSHYTFQALVKLTFFDPSCVLLFCFLLTHVDLDLVGVVTAEGKSLLDPNCCFFIASRWCWIALL